MAEPRGQIDNRRVVGIIFTQYGIHAARRVVESQVEFHALGVIFSKAYSITQTFN